MDLNRALKNFGRDISNNSPTILSAMAVLGVVTTVIMAVKATPKAMEVIEAEERFREEEGNLPKIDILDKVELTWRYYWPAAASGVITIGCIIGSNHISVRKNTALISLLGVAESTLREYQEKVVQTIGEGKEEKIRAEIAQETLNRNPVSEKTVILTGAGDYLCYDKFSGRYFRSHISKIEKATNEFNRRLNLDGWLNINYFYDLLGLEAIDMGEEMGWMAERALLDIKVYTRNEPETQEPALVIDYRVSPYHI